MKNPDSAFFRPDTCLTEERLLNYLEGNLNSSEQHAVEMHLLDCELCSDALEGIQLMKDPSTLKSINEQLKTEIEATLLEEEMPVASVLFPWRIAAAFALIFVSAATLWFVLPKTNTEKLFTQEYKPYPSPTENTAPSTPAISQEPIQIKPTEEMNSSTPVVKSENTKKALTHQETTAANQNMERETKFKGNASEEKAVAEAAPASSDEESVADNAKTSVTTDKEEITTTKILVPTATNESSLKKQTKAEQAQPAAAMSKRNADIENVQSTAEIPSDIYWEAMNLYQQEKFAEAAKLFDEVKSKPEALFYCGVSYLSSNQPQLAIKRLKEYRNTKSTTYTEASWWYEGLANLKMDKKKDASAAFKEVVKLNGEHAVKAQELLMKL